MLKVLLNVLSPNKDHKQQPNVLLFQQANQPPPIPNRALANGRASRSRAVCKCETCGKKSFKVGGAKLLRQCMNAKTQGS